MDYRPAFPSQMGIKGRLWLTNVFQDGSHEKHFVFKAVVVKECLNSGDFLTYFPPFGFGKEKQLPDLCPFHRGHAAASQPPAPDPRPGGSRLPFTIFFLSVYLMSF